MRPAGRERGQRARPRAATVYVTGAATTPVRNAHLHATFGSAFC
ncbi:hypothetical protein ACWENQ_06920 [Nonomuraea sp. NPDC004354]